MKSNINRTNIIFDLDETLIHTNENHELDNIFDHYIPKKSKLFIVDLPYDVVNDKVKVAKMWGLTRPYFDDLIEYCFDNFNQVIIWSAGTERYVRDTVKRVFSHIKNPDQIYTRKHILQTKKENTKPIEYLSKNNPELGLTLKNTIIVDDQIYNFSHNNKNGILIPQYLPLEYEKMNIEKKIKSIENDKALFELKEWLEDNNIQSIKDVRDIDKKDIFS